MAEMVASLGQGLIYVILGVFFIWLVKKVDDWRTREFDDDVEIDDGNVAVGLRRAGLYLGIAIALSGAMGGASKGFFPDLFQLMIDGLIITGFMFSSRFVNDFIMLGKAGNDQECIKTIITAEGKKIRGNAAVGIVEAGMSGIYPERGHIRNRRHLYGGNRQCGPLFYPGPGGPSCLRVFLRADHPV